jgi:hypothetical protein
MAVTVESFGCADARLRSKCRIRRATTICLVDRYYSGDQTKEVEMVVACGRCGEEKYIQGLVWIRPRKEPLTRSRSRWQCNFKMDLKATGCGNVNWILLVQGRNKWRAVDSTVMNRLVP